MLQRQRGFTLIELIVVIIILGILAVVAAPKFVDVRDEAQQATIKGVGAAFKAGVDQVHLAWLLRGNGQAVQNFIENANQVVSTSTATDRHLSVNSFGYPADSRGTSLTMNSTNDCIDVWNSVMDTQGASVNSNDSEDYRARYSASTCTYEYVAEPSYTIFYNSNTGEVTVNL